MDSFADRVRLLPPERREQVLKRLTDRLTADRKPADRILPRLDEQALLPLSHLQEHLWFLDQLAPGTSTYNLGATFRLRGRVDVGALCMSLHRLIGRHEALRTSIQTVDGQPVQAVSAGAGWVTVQDLSQTDPDARDAEAERCAREAVERPFALATELLFRAGVIILGPEDYLLTLTMHHICVDGWSAQILVNELAEIYRAALAGEEPGLAVPEIHYPDFALWQRDSMNEKDLEGQLAFWEQTLQNLPILALPTDRARPVVPSDRSDTVSMTLNGPVVAALGELSRTHGTTLFMTLIAAFDAVLARYTGQDDIVIGTTTTGRGRPQLEGVVGHFVNMVVLRTDLGGNPTFAEMLSRVKRTVVDAWRNQDVPFEKVVARLRPERDPGRNPLFQVGLQLLPGAAAGAPLRLPDTDVTMVEVGLDRHPFDLSLTVIEEPDALHITADYRTDLFDSPRTTRLVQHLINVLRAVAADPELRLGDLPLLGTVEREHALEAWQGARRPYRREPVHQQIADQATRTPSAVAVRHGADELTYAQLIQRAEHLANYLRSRGVTTEDIVAVGLDRGPDTVVAFLGVMSAGAAFLPLDLAHPSNRLAYQLSDTAAKVVVSHARLRDRLPDSSGWEPVYLDEDSPAIAAAGSPVGASAVTESSLAYVLYTSGSTGTPKGVLIEHGALSNFTAWMTGVFELGPGDRMLQYAAVNFDLAEGEIFSALTSGATLVLVPDELRSDPAAVSALIAAEQVSYLGAPPAVLSLIPAGDHPHLRKILVGGEALPGELVNRWRAPGRRFVNGYGPTEVTIGCSYYSCEHGEWHGQPPIGRAMPNRFVYVLDRFDAPTPVGVPGEITVGGVGLARGYLNAPELTAQRFVANPFRPGELMYRTGDLGVWNDAGQLQFLGRIDNQVKLRGLRVELEEIEACLVSHPDVARASVMLRTDVPGGPRLVAYIVPGARTPTEAELRGHAAQELPANIVPGSFVMLSELPLTSVGKVDRAALPAPVVTQGRAPRSDSERVLCELFAEVLGVESVTIDDSFFDLGGYSLLVVRLAGRVREVLGAELDIRALFDAPTVAGIAHRLGADASDDGDRLPEAEGRSAAAIAGPRPERVPLSFAQQRLWFLSQWEGPSATYNVPMALRLRGGLDVAALAEALNDVVARHETLRTVFPAIDGQAHQQVLDPRDAVLALQVHDCAEDELAGAMAQAADTVFDLAVDVPIRAWLFAIGPRGHVLVVVLHHIAGDGLSLFPLMNDLSSAYQARCAGAAPAWQPLPIQYADYTLRQRAQLGDVSDPDSVMSRQLAYWTETLRGLPQRVELATDRPYPAVASHRGDMLTFAISAELHRQLLELAQRHRVTMFMVFQAALAALLTRLGAGTDIPIGAPSAGRHDAALDDLVGFFVNTLVLRTDTSGDPSFSTLLARVRETDLSAFAHQDLPFETLAEALNPPRSAAHHPLFQIVLQVNSGGTVDLPPLGEAAVTPELIDLHVAKFDLVLGAEESHDEGGRATGILGSFEYATDLFDRESVQDLADRLVLLLETVTVDPARPLHEIELLTAPERRQVLESFNDTAREVPAATLPDLFEAQVERTPQAVAVLADDNVLTYEQLDSSANQLARHLVSLGVGPGTVVAVALPRGIELMRALYAVHKAGGAYLPLDSDHPADRLGHMVRQSRPVCVLTTTLTGFPALDVPVVHLDDDAVREMVAAQPTACPDRALRPDDAAYVIYTSGSTGRPKGVVVQHRAIVNRLRWMQAQYPLAADDRVLQKTPAGFDVSVWEFFWALQVGAAVVLAAPGEHLDPRQLVARVRGAGVTTLHFVPSMLQAFLDEPLAATCTSLRRVFSSGEALTASLRRRYFEFLDAPLHNLYGPTEAAVDVTAWHCRPDDDAPVVPIGRPVWNTQIYVLDEWLRPVPPGVPGELHIAGDQLALGYHGQPGLTAERFLPNPYGPAGTLMYRSGDLARWRRDGALEYLGRVDDQIKIRGVRIEPQEISAVLEEHPGVEQAVVVSRSDEGAGPQLVGYLVPDPVREPVLHTLARLRRHGSFPDEWQHRLANGMIVAAPDKAQVDFLYRELYEGDSLRPADIPLPAGACVFDVGAHVGLFTLAVAALHPDAAIYAFEPIPQLMRMLAVNVELYRVNATLFDYGLAERAQTVPFTYYPQLSIMSGRYADEADDRRVVEAYVRTEEGSAGDTVAIDETSRARHWDELLTDRLRHETLELPVRTLSEAIDDTGVTRIDLLKIDVEKSEHDVLLGIRDEHWLRIQQILVEVHDTEGRVETIRTLLTGRGYQVSQHVQPMLAGARLVNLLATRQHERAAAVETLPAAASVAFRSDPDDFISDVRATAHRTLPDHMVPQRFVLLDRLPLTANGKLDRRSLPDPQRLRASGGRNPRNPREEMLCELFAEVLKLDRVTIDDSFFDLGGHSLLAVQLVSRMSTVMGIDVGVRSLFATPTPAGLLDGSGSGDSSLAVLLPLRATGGQAPLFCVHPFTGLSWGYAGLAQHINTDRPIYGLQSRRLLDPDEPVRSVEELARDYLAEIRAVQPHGPYHLLGWSFGGLVAHALATELRAAGEQVALLALLDAYPVEGSGDASNPPTPAEILGVLVGDLDGVDGSLEVFPEPAELARLLRAANPALASLDTAEIGGLVRAATGHVDVMRHFRPGRFDGDLVFFTATSGRPDDAPTVDVWRRHVNGRITAHDVEATHWTMTEPAAIAQVGRVVRGLIDE